MENSTNLTDRSAYPYSEILALVITQSWGYEYKDEVMELIKSIREHEGKAFNPVDLLMLTTQNIISRLLLNERYEENDASGKMIRDFV